MSNEEFQNRGPGDVDPATLADVLAEAEATMKRLCTHEQLAASQVGASPVIAQRCAYLAAVMSDVIDGRITGPEGTLRELVATGVALCDMLDACREGAIVDESGALQ